MKRGMRLSGVVLLALAALVSLSCTGEEEGSGPFSKFLSRYHKVAVGTVSKLDKDKKSMTVTNKKGVPVEVSWDDKTKVEGELADGARVTVIYKMKTDRNIATSVKASTAAGAAPATTTASTVSAPTTATTPAPSTTATAGAKAKPPSQKK
jgi:hypothetical protein